MSHVYLPAHVVVLFRRLVDVISVLSISTQYLRLVKNGPQQPRASDPSSNTDAPNRTAIGTDCERCKAYSSWGTFQALRAVEWPWWTFPGSWSWHQLTMLGSTKPSMTETMASQASTFNATSSVNFPWSGRAWTWPSFTAILVNGSASSDNIDPPPPPPSSNEGSPKNHKTSSTSPTKTFEQFPYHPTDVIHDLLQNPALYDPVRTPRYPIVLCHGLYGFDVRGPASFPSLRMHYWSNVLNVLRDKVGAEVLVTSVPATGSIASRSHTLHRKLQEKACGRSINFIAHSMGGLDCRHLISHIKPTQYAPLSLTTISTPHRGSPFMDWCVENIGIGKLRGQEPFPPVVSSTLLETMPSNITPNFDSRASRDSSEPSIKSEVPFTMSLASLPSSFTTLLLSIVDSPAYANLTTTYLTRVFNPLTPDDPRVRYFSVAGRMGSVNIWHPLWLPKMVLDGVEARTRAQLKEEWENSGTDNVGDKVHDTENKGRDGMDVVPLWARDDKWGNDGLVTVQSARWGKFLGTLEGCDHWAMRGARGIELNVDLKPGHVMDGWTLPDWGRLVGSWKRGEGIVESEAIGGRGRRADRNEQERADEAMIKSSTDKLSAVFDWLVEQVPAPRFSSRAKDERTEGDGDTSKSETVKRDLETRMDLERFYVALSRKLYEEGL